MRTAALRGAKPCLGACALGQGDKRAESWALLPGVLILWVWSYAPTQRCWTLTPGVTEIPQKP
jgi:hypothetical protein